MLAISVDPHESNRTFAQAEGLTYPVLSDPDGEVVHLYGVGRGTVARRITFVLDPAGVIRYVDRHVRVSSHGTDILTRVRALQAQARANRSEKK